MDKFLLIFCVAVIVETITEYIKNAFPVVENNTGIIFLITAILGISSAIAFNADIFSSFGFVSTIPYFGCVMTGLVCAGGSNIVYDIIHRISNKNNVVDISDFFDDDVEG